MMSDPNIAVKNVTIDTIPTQYVNTAFRITGAFQLIPVGTKFIVDGQPGSQAMGVQPCKFSFPHPGYASRGGQAVTVSVLGVSATSNRFPVV